MTLHRLALDFNERFEEEVARWKVRSTHGPWLVEREPGEEIEASYKYEWIHGSKEDAARHCRIQAISHVLHEMGIT